MSKWECNMCGEDNIKPIIKSDTCDFCGDFCEVQVMEDLDLGASAQTCIYCLNYMHWRVGSPLKEEEVKNDN